MTRPDIAAINALGPDEMARRLSGSAQDVAGFVREAAEAGSSEAQAVYAQMLLDGRSVRADPPAAFHWFMVAARQEHLLAINMVGRCFDLGWGVPVDKVQAAAWFKSAAVRGLDWGMYNYATALALGQGVGEDKAAALDWLERAAALGNAKAINFVGSFHEDGWVGPRDVAKAAACYARAADGGDFRGQFNHARMLIEAGRVDEALPWLQRAGEGGNDRFRGQAAAWLARSADDRLDVATDYFARREP